MKKVINITAFICFITAAVFLQGCMKEKYQQQDVKYNTTRLITEFTDGKEPLSRLSLNDAAAPVEIDFAEVRAVPRSVFSGTYNVTVVSDPTLVDKYNSTLDPDDPNDLPYEAAPADAVEIVNPQNSITAESAESFIVKARIKTGALAGKRYAFGIKISQVTQGEVSGNTGTYLVALTVKNALDGEYNWDFTRWNNNTGTGAVQGSSFTGEVTTMSTLTATSAEVASGYFIQPRYVISFKNTGGVLSDFSVKLNDDDVAALLDEGVEVVDGPNILVADPVAGRYKFQYIVFNGAAFRYLVDEYYK